MNITPANRVLDIQEYYFSRKLREVAELNRRGCDIISLGIGGPDRMPDESVTETLCRHACTPGEHSYQPYNGLPELRLAYSQWYRRYFNVNLNPDTEILPLIGSKEGVLHISLAFLNPGDGVLVPNPGYPTYTSVSKLVGAEVFTYDLTEVGDWKPDFEALERMPLERIKLMWVNYPHMPTGTPADPEVMSRLIEFAHKHSILLACDNPYSFILNTDPVSILSFQGAEAVAVELNSLSKSHNMAGWRMGMVAGNPQFIQWILKVKSNIDSGQFRPMMEAAAKALSLGPEWYAELNAVYAERRNVAEDIMTALGCSFDQAQRGLFLWGRIPDGETSETFCDKILRDARVFVTPGFIFGSNGEGYLRISLCATAEAMTKALERIRATMK